MSNRFQTEANPRARRAAPSAPFHGSPVAASRSRVPRHRRRAKALCLRQRRQRASSTAWRDYGPATSATAARSSRKRLMTRWSSCRSTIRSSRRRIRRSSRCRASSPNSPPTHLNQVFFGSSGSESNDTAIRLIRHYWALKGEPKRRIIISRKNAYHGSTIAAGSMGGMAHVHHAQLSRL